MTEWRVVFSKNHVVCGQNQLHLTQESQPKSTAFSPSNLDHGSQPKSTAFSSRSTCHFKLRKSPNPQADQNVNVWETFGKTPSPNHLCPTLAISNPERPTHILLSRFFGLDWWGQTSSTICMGNQLHTWATSSKSHLHGQRAPHMGKPAPQQSTRGKRRSHGRGLM